MKYFITGGLGFIGSAVVRLAISEGHEVLNVDAQTYAANVRNVESVANHPNYRFQRADICDASTMDGLIKEFQPDCIIHLAAESHVDRSIDGPDTFIQTNIQGTFVLLEVARKYNIRFLHVSTDEVYGSIETGAFTPDSPYQPNSPYSASKAGSDMLARAWFHTYGLETMISNCSNNYGMCQFPEKLIPTVIQNAVAGNPIPVYGNGQNVRDWLYVEDHARALLLIATEGTPGETYTIGGNCDIPNLDLIHMICDILQETTGTAHKDQITFVTDRPGHDQRYAIDASYIKDKLGWEPSVTLEQGLGKTVAWYLENPDWFAGVQTGRLGLKAS